MIREHLRVSPKEGGGDGGRSQGQRQSAENACSSVFPADKLGRQKHWEASSRSSHSDESNKQSEKLALAGKQGFREERLGTSVF